MKMCAANNCSRPVFGKGFCKSHQYMRADFDRRSPLQKHLDSVKNGTAVKAEVVDEGNVKVDSDNSLQKWFEERRKEMVGRCAHCGGPSCANSDKFYKYSICHILPKAHFPSVATHTSNWIELCFWKNNCHGNMDNKILDLTDMNCWDDIVERFLAMYPSIDKKERRRIPSLLMQYVNIDI